LNKLSEELSGELSDELSSELCSELSRLRRGDRLMVDSEAGWINIAA